MPSYQGKPGYWGWAGYYVLALSKAKVIWKTAATQSKNVFFTWKQTQEILICCCLFTFLVLYTDQQVTLGFHDCNLSVWKGKGISFHAFKWNEKRIKENQGGKENHINQIRAKINSLWRHQYLHPSKTTRGSTKCLRVSTIQSPGTNLNVQSICHSLQVWPN